jgi:hypothetical protein
MFASKTADWLIANISQTVKARCGQMFQLVPGMGVNEEKKF